MSACTIIPFPGSKRGMLDRWLHYVVAGYCVIALVFLVYGTTEYLSASTRLMSSESLALAMGQNGFDWDH